MPKKVQGKLTEILLENLIDAVIGIDKSGRIRIFNPMASQLFALAASEALDRKIWDVFRVTDFTRALISMVKESSAAPREQVILFPGERIFLSQLIPVRSEDGRLQGAVAILKDMTTLHQMEKDMTQFVGTVSHELKVPLTSIKGFVETLLEGAYTDGPVCRKFLQIINEETNRLARLIVSLLNVSSGSGGEDRLEKKPIEIDKLIGGVVGLLQPIAAEKNLTLTLRAPEELPLVPADEDKIKQVIMNLLDNAIKFTGIMKEGSVIVELLRERKGIRVRVIDTGIGIPEEEHDKIFERFYRVKEGPAAELGGTGLGLSITKQIVEAHGGNLSLESAPGRGSTFSFLLPFDRV
jgi:two-component system phosphate regulon sensor histidine kinase PhoR